MQSRNTMVVLLASVLPLLPASLAVAGQAAKTVIAIVDFKNTSANHDLDYLEATIPEAISTTLARGGRLEIVERGLLEKALQEMEMSMLGVVDETTAARIGRAVGANAIMVGSFASIGTLIRINTRLIDVQTGKILMAESVQGGVGEQLFALMDQVAMSMEWQLTGRVAEAARPLPVTTPDSPTIRPLGVVETRNIRVRKLAQDWTGRRVRITLTDGKRVAGTFAGADLFDFKLDGFGGRKVFPIDKVKSVTLRPGLGEAVLVLVGGALGGGLTTGIIALTVDNASPETLAGGFAVGAAAGLWWGYRAFFHEVVIELSE